MATNNIPNPPTRRRPQVELSRSRGEYPLIDNDPHLRRVIRFARPSDWYGGAALAAGSPGLLYLMERVAPSHVAKGGFAPVLRMSTALGVGAGFLYMYSRSCMRFYGAAENAREVEKDMQEMVVKVKAGEPLYGTSTLSEYMQGVAARNSRYTAFWSYVIPWFNIVNHNQHGVDTAKYYRQAERELEAERQGGQSS